MPVKEELVSVSDESEEPTSPANEDAIAERKKEVKEGEKKDEKRKESEKKDEKRKESGEKG